MLMQGVRAEMWPVGCEFEPDGWSHAARRGIAAYACTGHAYAVP